MLKNRAASPCTAFRRQERGRELLVKAKKKFNARLIVSKRFGTIAALYGAVELLMGAEKVGGHEKWVV